MNIVIQSFETLGSTNTEALRSAREGAAEGVCVMARSQTAGRGRHGRTWSSKKDAGLYFSIILRPNLPVRSLPLLTLMSGVAAHDMLREYDLVPDIKWVNDVLVDEKKISGILAETAETRQGIAVVVGVGINLTSGNFPPEIKDTATSIEELSGVKVSPDDAARTLTKYISRFYGVLTARDGSEAIIDEWRTRSSYYAGKPVRVVTGSETIIGKTAGLEPNGALRVLRSDGEITVVQAGDVERLRAAEFG